ncbi:MAG: Kae1-associated serine/threonine protein kinase [Candidatus Aenigmarchaeota archaeon]|nr:Kae1-associated serine/threonine protein kinase [Candidatus Aenigmarchaeota archaeon]
MKIIQRGAEAVLYLREELNEKRIVKERVSKGYRIPEIDEKIRKLRTRHELKLLSKARQAGIQTPKAWSPNNYNIVMDYIEGSRVKDVFNGMEGKERKKLCVKIGEIIAKLHENGMIHGDLTTSNMIIDKKGTLFLIDFGLGKFSSKIEDQAVDLFLLQEAIKSTHFDFLEEFWKNVLKGYVKYPRSGEVIRRFEQIEKRRRYKK